MVIMNNKLLNSADAATLTLEHAAIKVEKINDLIKEACLKGDCQIFLSEENWTPTIRLFLKNNNYQTSQNPINNGGTSKYLVSWEHVIKNKQ